MPGYYNRGLVYCSTCRRWLLKTTCVRDAKGRLYCPRCRRRVRVTSRRFKNAKPLEKT